MRHRLYLLLAATLAATVPTSSPHAQGERGNNVAASSARTVVLPFQGRMREYLLYVPARPNGSLVLAFHGGGQTAAQMQEISGFDLLADRERFIVAYPQAVERSWVDGANRRTSAKLGIDDVAFAKAVVADIASTHRIDRSRVFATGLSNGGVFAHRLGCEAAETFAAIAPVIGTIASGVAPVCRPSAPVAVVSVLGVADPSVAFEGSSDADRAAGTAIESSRETERLWRSLNGCAATATSTQLPVLVKDGTSVVRRSYAGCRGQGDVVWYEIHGGGHRWPPHRYEGRQEALSLDENGVSSQNINATEVIWAFFASHARR